MPGPPPNRSGNLSRARDAHRGGKEITKGTMRPVELADAPDDWHPVAKMVWNAMQESGIADFYQATDWAYAYVVLSELSAYRTPGVNKETGEPYAGHRPSGQMFQAIMAAMTSLGLAEGDRRRMRIELESPKPDDVSASVTAIGQYKNRLGITRGGELPDAPSDPSAIDQETDRLPDPGNTGS